MRTPVEPMDAARAPAGLDDFGQDSFREGRDRLLHSLEHEARLSDVGAASFPT